MDAPQPTPSAEWSESNGRRRLPGASEVRPAVVRFVRGHGILIAFGLLILIGASQSPHFLTPENFANVARQASIAGILGIGMTFVILTAGIDLSVGSILGIAAVVFASLLAGGMPWPAAIVLALLLGAGVGALNGLGITKGGLQPFIMTLAMLVIARGVTLTYTDAKPVRVGEQADEIAWIGNGSVVGIPVPFLLFAGIAVAAWFVLRHTTFGRQVYAVGDNTEAARLVGIPTNRVVRRGIRPDRGVATGRGGGHPGRGVRARRDRDGRDRRHEPVRRFGRGGRHGHRRRDHRGSQQPVEPDRGPADLPAHRKGADHPRRRPAGAPHQGQGGRQVSP